MKNNHSVKQPKALPGWPPFEPNTPEITPDVAWILLKKHIKHRMRVCGYHSLESLAQAAEMNKGVISKTLNSKRDPQFSTLWRIISALGWNEFPRINSVPDPKPEDWDSL